MRKEELCEAIGDINEIYIRDAYGSTPAAAKIVRMNIGALAACLCIMLIGGILFTQNNSVPNPDMLQVPNPIVSVKDKEEMEEYLDFDVPVLDKEVINYSVLVIGGYPSMGQVDYDDGSEFRMEYGSGDISGIYGGTLEETNVIDGVDVEYYRYADTAYAIWEQDGFTFSYSYTDESCAGDVETIIGQFK